MMCKHDYFVRTTKTYQAAERLTSVGLVFTSPLESSYNIRKSQQTHNTSMLGNLKLHSTIALIVNWNVTIMIMQAMV